MEPPPVSRRHFLKLASAGVAAAGFGSYTRRGPNSDIVPYRDVVPELTPGRPLYYATSMMLGGYATGLLVESHVGRPTKVEGNLDHPASLGAAGVIEQTSIFGLYDPQGGQHVSHRGESCSWLDLERALAPQQTYGPGSRLHILLEPTSSPLAGGLLPASGLRQRARA